MTRKALAKALGFGAALAAATAALVYVAVPVITAPVTTYEWAQKVVTAPSLRWYGAMAYDAANANTIFVGGGLSYTTVYNDTWRWNGTAWTQLSPAHAPEAAVGKAITYDPAVGILTFAGFNGTAATNDLRVWNGTDWVTPAARAHDPAARWGANMVHETSRSVDLMFGGIPSTADTWQFNATVWDWQQLSPATSPPARFLAAMAYDAARQRVVMFGGASTGALYPVLGDTWEWNGTTWAQITTTHTPAARYGATMHYDSARQRVVLFGGFADANQTWTPTLYATGQWSFDGTDWTLDTPADQLPPLRGGASLAYDTTANAAILFGGYNAVDVYTTPRYLADTWVNAKLTGSPVSHALYATDASVQSDAWAVAACGDAGGLYAAPTGHGADGGPCTCAAPCTLTGASVAARGQLAGATGDTVVNLHGGTYRVTTPLTLDATYSGQNGHKLIFRAATNETPVLSGSIRLNGWRPEHSPDPSTTADPYLAVYSAPVPVSVTGSQLFVNGRRAIRARGVIAGVGTTKWTTDGGVPTDAGTFPGHGFAPGSATAAAWTGRTKMEAVGTGTWRYFRCPVTSLTADRVTLAEPCWSSSQAANPTLNAVEYFENARELLDAPGEWYFDELNHRVYYYPRADENLTTAVVELAAAPEVLRVEGTPAVPVENVDFDGLTFEHTTWAPSATGGYAGVQAGWHWSDTAAWPHQSVSCGGTASMLTGIPAGVVAKATHGVRFLNSTFRQMGGTALGLEYGAQANAVDNCRFDDTGGAAVTLGSVTTVDDHHPSDSTLEITNNAITNNLVTRAGAEFPDTPGVFVGWASHTAITNNELTDLPYTGISVGWGWGCVDVDPPAYCAASGCAYVTASQAHANDISNNVVAYVMRKLRDGGAIYTNGIQDGSTIAGNVVAEQGGAYGLLYFDTGAGFTVTDTVGFNLSGVPDAGISWCFFNGGAPGTNSLTSSYLTDATTSCTASGTTAITYADFSAAAAVIAAAGSALRDPEIARNKTASASSVYSTYAAANACDGNAFTTWWASDYNGWWKVDLGANYLVSGVDVAAPWAYAGTSDTSRASYVVEASVNADMSGATTLATVGATALDVRAILHVTAAPPVTARYVRLRKTAAGAFMLGEVLVYGVAAP